MEKYAIIELEDGRKINLVLYPEIAPLSVALFINNAKQGKYQGTIFHRIIKDFMIQTGGYIIKDNTLMEAPDSDSIKGEFTKNGVTNDLLHVKGVVSLARTNDPNSASGQFFICTADCGWLNGSYAAFGKVNDEASMEVVMSLNETKTVNIGGGFSDFPKEVIAIKDIIIGE